LGLNPASSDLSWVVANQRRIPLAIMIRKVEKEVHSAGPQDMIEDNALLV